MPLPLEFQNDDVMRCSPSFFARRFDAHTTYTAIETRMSKIVNDLDL